VTVSFDALNQATAAYRDASAMIRLERFRVPLNRPEEERLFLNAVARGRTYNPRFAYEQPTPDLATHLNNIRRKLPPADYWRDLLAGTIRYDIETLAALDQRSAASITTVSSSVFGKPDDALVAEAHQTLSSSEHAAAEPQSEADVDAETTAAALGDALAAIGLEEWRVEVTKELNVRISVQPARRLIRVRGDARFTHADVRRLLVHEIGTHVLRSVNGERQPLKLLSLGVGRYLLTEEGLASLLEREHGVQDLMTQRIYALRVLAVASSLRGSFHDAYAAISSYVDPEQAFELVLRAKRGIGDTSEAGAYTKDIVYAKGFDAVSQHLAEHPEDRDLLFCGKLGLEMLDEARSLRESGILLPPLHHPEKLLQRIE
jgi:uncharacterized protein (TIGR02421 family)